jgi:phosphoribosylaminoimidazole-succinocarboxamide synthase
MDTPSTKSESDESLSWEDAIKRGLVTPSQAKQLANSGIMAFGIASHYLSEKGIILVDTKFEHGINSEGKMVSQDEILTMDSSRYWKKRDYEYQIEQLNKGEIKELNPKSFSKEFARGFSEGEKGYTYDQRRQIAVRYIEGIEELLSIDFVPDLRPRDERVVSGLHAIVNQLIAE